MHYLYRYVCILNVFFHICIWTNVCNKEFIYFIILVNSDSNSKMLNHINMYIYILQNIMNIGKKNTFYTGTCP